MRFSLRPFRSLFFLIFLVECGLAFAEQDPVFSARLGGDIAALSLDEPGIVRLTLATPEGMHTLWLRKRAPFSPQENLRQTPVRLFQGRLLRDSRYNPRVAASIIGEDLALVFYGRRRGRMYEAHFRLNSGIPARSGRLQHYSRHMRIGCATTLGGLHDDSSTAAYLPENSAALPAFSPSRYLEISTDADYEYFKSYREQTNANIQAILNTAEAIYTSQLGIRFDIIRQHAFSNRALSPLTSDDSLTLLDQFRRARLQLRHLGIADVYQLYTGKNLFGSIIGLSYVGPACQDRDYSVSLVMKVSSSIQALVSAHELGHSLGAHHPEDYLTNPAYSLMTGIVRPGQDEFSSFSLGEINSHLSQWDPSGTCLSETIRLRLGLSVHTRALTRSSKVRLQANLAPIGEANGCQLTLYGSERLATLGTSLPSTPSAKLLYDSSVDYNKIILRGTAKTGSSTRFRNAYYRAYLVCPDSRSAFSPRRRAKVRGYGPRASLTPYFESLRDGLKIQ